MESLQASYTAALFQQVTYLLNYGKGVNGLVATLQMIGPAAIGFFTPSLLNIGIGINDREQQFRKFIAVGRGQLLCAGKYGFDALVQRMISSSKLRCGETTIY